MTLKVDLMKGEVMCLTKLAHKSGLSDLSCATDDEWFAAAIGGPFLKLSKRDSI